MSVESGRWIKQALVGVSRTPPLSTMLSSMLARRPLVLMFHRFRCEDEGVRGHDLRLIERSMEFLHHERYDVVGLGELVDHAIEERPFERPTVCLTVDDGYWDQAEIGGALFARFGFPATFFVSTGFLDADLWLWDSKVEYILGNSRHERVVLDVPIPLRIELARRSRTDVSREVIRSLTRIDATLIDAVIDALAAACEVELPDQPPRQFAPMSWEQARGLETQGMSIAPHSVSHRLLARLPEADARFEVAESWRRVQKEVRAPLDVFGYPSGRNEDFTARDAAIVKEAGMRAAVSAQAGFPLTVDTVAERFSIPRIGMPGAFMDFVQCVSGVELLKDKLGWSRFRSEAANRHV